MLKYITQDISQYIQKLFLYSLDKTNFKNQLLNHHQGHPQYHLHCQEIRHYEILPKGQKKIQPPVFMRKTCLLKIEKKKNVFIKKGFFFVNIGLETFWSNLVFFWFGQTNFWSKKIFDKKKLSKNRSLWKKFWTKQSSVKIISSQKFFGQKNVESKKLWPKQIFSKMRFGKKKCWLNLGGG